MMMYLCSMGDPGLIILPAHRIVTRLSYQAEKRLFEEGGRFFSVNGFDFPKDDPAGAGKAVLSRLASSSSAVTIAVVAENKPGFSVFSIMPGAMERFASEIPEVLRNLDVTVLTRMVLMELLGLSRADMDDPELIVYDVNAGRAMERVLSGNAAAAFLINPTRIEHVRAVAEAGLTMPRKSTYFFPKVITGLVFNPLR
jgi:hypothetical protein